MVWNGERPSNRRVDPIHGDGGFVRRTQLGLQDERRWLRKRLSAFSFVWLLLIHDLFHRAERRRLAWLTHVPFFPTTLVTLPIVQSPADASARGSNSRSTSSSSDINAGMWSQPERSASRKMTRPFFTGSSNCQS